jgi:hypothetical protein
MMGVNDIGGKADDPIRQTIDESAIQAGTTGKRFHGNAFILSQHFSKFANFIKAKNMGANPISMHLPGEVENDFFRPSDA